jgi:hypothetical protein
MMRKVLLLLLLAGAVSCRAPRPGLSPAAGPAFRSLGIKFSFSDGQARQNGRIAWRFDGERSKFVFFTPLGQAGLELDVSGEDAVLVNFSRKEQWQGEFRVLLERMWGVDMSLSTLKEIVLSGKVPRAELAAKGIAVDLAPGGRGGAPKEVRLRRDGADLRLRVTRDESRPGRVVLAGYGGRYPAAELASVLEMAE